jgi:hypothetical protein
VRLSATGFCGGAGHADDLIDDVRVHGAVDDRDGLCVARGGLRARAGKVAVFAEPGADPTVLQVACAGHGAQLGQLDVHDRGGVGARAARDKAGAQQ